MTTKAGVTRLAVPQIKEASLVLARAFYDDPFTIYVTPDDAKRRRVLPWYYSAATRYGHLFGEVYTTADRTEGVAIWLPPDKAIVTTIRLVRVGLLATPLRLGLAAFRRLISAMNHLEQLHKRAVPPQHWYLVYLGVDPPRQGQGIGSALMRPILARADAEGLPCYVETAQPKSVPLYQRHGFEIVVAGDLLKGGPHLWTMKREPQR
jgi:ribosomal protein S18 acetylase RimI-like enzyme